MGHSQVGPCSCNWRYDVASKHWLCRQDTDRHGREILSVDRGHLSDKTEAVVTMSASRALLSTILLVRELFWGVQLETHCHQQQTSQWSSFRSLISSQDPWQVYSWPHIRRGRISVTSVRFSFRTAAQRWKATGKDGKKRMGVEAANLRTATDLGCQSICHLDSIAVCRKIEAQLFGDINRSSRAWFVLQAAQIGLDFSSVDFDFWLVWEGNILPTMSFSSTKYHNFQSGVLEYSR